MWAGRSGVMEGRQESGAWKSVVAGSSLELRALITGHWSQQGQSVVLWSVVRGLYQLSCPFV